MLFQIEEQRWNVLLHLDVIGAPSHLEISLLKIYFER